MNGIKNDTMVDEAVARAIPALRPLLGKQVEITALESTALATSARRLSVDELLASRIKLPPGVGPLSLDDMERAIADEALGVARQGHDDRVGSRREDRIIPRAL